MIGRLKNFVEDILYIAQVNSFTASLPNDTDMLHLHRSSTERFIRPQDAIPFVEEQKMDFYLCQLSSTQLKRIYQVYEIDFEMFGSGTNKYVNYDHKRL